ncbi:MAG: hypothetical protein MI864_02385 [Pseudomonadales bacterium]|uniref:Cytoplasmic protein n=1 Tax=Oleiphilus messinensis TaxID=141451 RepID=A0A1Y0I5A5_9GAMM|nr:hypothetical protein [Oleiphilus messinensis]ARU54715.1 hypothetical protein OLMES_0612 [Oleiphilus messinensis]MCG8609358.1 hypothetical protein [Pseudomonadales bacterium]
MQNQSGAPEVKMDTDALYLEEVFTDQKVGTIRKMTPVTIDGTPDANRPTLFLGQAQMLTPAGALPLNFEIEAATLAEAVEKFSAAAQDSMEKTIEELKEMRRQQASSLVIPDGAGGMGGMPGGGKIQMP